MDILVIGCGVSGLTTGIRLLEAGHRVTIWARDMPGSRPLPQPPAVTSEVAAAVWYPYKAYPQERVNAWGAAAYRVFRELAAQGSPEEHGVVMREVVEALPQPAPDPWWVEAVRDTFRHARAGELPAGYIDGYIFAAPVIDMSIYLGYLQRRFMDGGGTISEHTIASLDEAFAANPIVVNCTGLGAREVVGDKELYPSRGQVVRIRPRGFHRVVMDDYGPNKVAYIVPRVHDIVLGGVDDEHNESVTPDESVTAGILARCGSLVPEMANVQPDDILAVVCGLRPARSTVRLEREEVAPGRIAIHNYGHGGAGVTLSWGCADEVVALVSQS
jgi:D-amino-acid oxidase